jgi:hypothetical protein
MTTGWGAGWGGGVGREYPRRIMEASCISKLHSSLWGVSLLRSLCVGGRGERGYSLLIPWWCAAVCSVMVRTLQVPQMPLAAFVVCMGWGRHKHHYTAPQQ